MTLAPGVVFDESKHEYWYRGKQLSGVTGLITKKLGMKLPQEFLEEHQEEGAHVHKAVQRWIETGESGSVHPGVRWLVDTIEEHFPVKINQFLSEVLVSDFKRYASAIDIIAERGGGEFILFDIKKGVFKRDYVTWQLSVYKYLFEKYGKRAVRDCVCICLRDREYYPIFPKSTDEVEKLLYGITP